MSETPPDKLLLCTDLDRTLLPNGEQPESADSRRLFRELVSNDNIMLAYVSGRDSQRVINAIREYDLPMPDFSVCDVGSSIYDLRSSQEQWLGYGLLADAYCTGLASANTCRSGFVIQ